jgi:HPt (histidine-containing phosphotransfer) domain-containing protein
MDGYLTKPIDRVQLRATLERWLTSEDNALEDIVDMTIATGSEEPIDWNRLLKATDQDDELARELAALFIDSGSSSMLEIVSALENRDYSKLGDKAHEIKGASANLQAAATQAAAERLEAAARNGDAEQVPELTRQLKTEVDRAVAYLRSRVA